MPPTTTIDEGVSRATAAEVTEGEEKVYSLNASLLYSASVVLLLSGKPKEGRLDMNLIVTQKFKFNFCENGQLSFRGAPYLKLISHSAGAW